MLESWSWFLRKSPCAICTHCIRNSTAAIGKKNQIILLMHDAAAKTTTVEALPGVIEAYRDAGYRFDVLSEDSFVWHHKVNN